MRASPSLLILPLIALLAGGAAKDLSSRATGNLAEIVSDEDYPPSAIRAGAQGIVAFELDVGLDGQVTACRVVSSSGTPILDETTCRLMVARAHFTPAHDRKGRPTTDRVRNRIRWILPNDESGDGNEAVPAETRPPS
jgi:protein TonB